MVNLKISVEMLGLELGLDLILIAAGIMLLSKCSDWAVDSAARVAAGLRISQLVIGLTVVSIGTSLPELAVSVQAALQGYGSIAVANIVGSNIYNLGFILGACALIRPVLTSKALVYRDCGVMLGATLILLGLVWDLQIGFLEGILLLGCLVAYLVLLYRAQRPLQHSSSERKLAKKDPVLLILGLGGVILGARFLLVGAVDLARIMGVSEWLIGVTIIAIGTSLPETAVSMAAIIHGYHEISAGNLVGSNIFNIFGIVGAAGALSAMSFTESAIMHTGLLLGLMVLVTMLMRSGWKISRLEGVGLLGIMGAGYYWIVLTS